MKRFKNGSILLENDEDKNKYGQMYCSIMNLIKIAEEEPQIWQIIKHENANEINLLYQKLIN
jgi:hypothetical protein